MSKRGTLQKIGYFIDIGLSSVKTVAVRHRHAAYHKQALVMSFF